MAKQQTYWIFGGGQGTYALVTGAAERDRWLADGDWALTQEPADGWVHIWHADNTTPGRVPVSALRDLWGLRGWVAGPPPDGVHPIVPESPADLAAEAKTEPAADGDAKKE